MIGEIRDFETAQIAIQASLTGHLVLATLHTNDAASAVTRLTDMGVEPFLLSSSLLGVLAQRLVRKLCTHCHGKGCEPPAATPATRAAPACSSCWSPTTPSAPRSTTARPRPTSAPRRWRRHALMREDGERLVRRLLI
jgi:general secretion pathway protein E